MKILFATYDAYDSVINGATLICHYLAESLARQGHEVRVLAGSPNPIETPIDKSSTQYELIHNTPDRKGDRGPDVIYDDSRQIPFFQYNLEVFKPDIVHFNHLEFLSPKMIPEARKYGCPTVYTAHDYYLACQQANLLTNRDMICDGPGNGSKCGRCYPCSKHDKNMYPDIGYLSTPMRYAASRYFGIWSRSYSKRSLLFKNCLIYLSSLVAPSHHALEKLNGLGFKTNKDIVIPNGIPQPDINISERMSNIRPRLVYLGGTRKHKGIYLLLDAIQKVRYETELFIYGPIDPIAKAFAKRRLRNCNSEVYFRGSFNHNNIDKTLTHKDFHILPSIWEETYSLVVVEALIRGIPSIVPDLGAAKVHGELGKNIFTFKFRNSDSLASVIEHAIENQHRIPSDYPRKEEWTIDAMAKRYECLYTTLLKDNHR